MLLVNASMMDLQLRFVVFCALLNLNLSTVPMITVKVLPPFARESEARFYKYGVQDFDQMPQGVLQPQTVKFDSPGYASLTRGSYESIEGFVKTHFDVSRNCRVGGVGESPGNKLKVDGGVFQLAFSGDTGLNFVGAHFQSLRPEQYLKLNRDNRNLFHLKSEEIIAFCSDDQRFFHPGYNWNRGYFVQPRPNAPFEYKPHPFPYVEIYLEGDEFDMVEIGTTAEPVFLDVITVGSWLEKSITGTELKLSTGYIADPNFPPMTKVALPVPRILRARVRVQVRPPRERYPRSIFEWNSYHDTSKLPMDEYTSDLVADQLLGQPMQFTFLASPSHPFKIHGRTAWFAARGPLDQNVPKVYFSTVDTTVRITPPQGKRLDQIAFGAYSVHPGACAEFLHKEEVIYTLYMADILNFLPRQHGHYAFDYYYHGARAFGQMDQKEELPNVALMVSFFLSYADAVRFRFMGPVSPSDPQGLQAFTASDFMFGGFELLDGIEVVDRRTIFKSNQQFQLETSRREEVEKLLSTLDVSEKERLSVLLQELDIMPFRREASTLVSIKEKLGLDVAKELIRLVGKSNMGGNADGDLLEQMGLYPAFKLLRIFQIVHGRSEEILKTMETLIKAPPE